MKNSILLLLIIISVSSCKKDDDFIQNTFVNDNPQTVSDAEFAQNNFGQAITANFIGQVFNTSGEKLTGVQISIGNQGVLTDHNGVFILNNALVFEKFAYVTASKNGYLKGSKTILPSPNGVNDIKITLLEKEIISSVTSGSSSEVSLPNGSKVAFQGDFIDATGNAYNGQVDVSLYYLEPNTENTFLEMPGMLFGMREDGSASGMETYGMLAVNLFSPNGEQLNILETSPATLTFPVSVSTPNAPNELPLWYFDEVTGYWKEQGIATKVGNEYIAEVSHFSWWNCDFPINSASICLSINNQSQLSSIKIEIIRDITNQVIYYGYMYNYEQICGLLPINEELIINYYGINECVDAIIHTESIGPFLADQNIIVDLFQITTVNQASITAFINDCDNNTLNNGYGLLFNTNSSSFSAEYLSIVNGQLNYSFNYCDGDEKAIIIFDSNSGLYSEIINLDLTENLNLGAIAVCDSNSGGTYHGDVHLETQEEVDLFSLFSYELIDGNLIIGNTDNYDSNITNLNNLENLDAISGQIAIANNPLLISLQGLENITSIGTSITILNNASLTSLNIFQNLSNIQSNLHIKYNNSLTNIYELGNVTSYDIPYYAWIEVSNNPLLESLIGLENLTSCPSVRIYNNDSLLTLEGLNNLTSSGIFIRDNDALVSIQHLSNLTIASQLHIEDNNLITSLDGLQNLNHITYRIHIVGNQNLNSIAQLQNVTRAIVDNLKIEHNASLTTLYGLHNLNGIGRDLIINDNPSLNSISGLRSLNTIGETITITDNLSLTSLSGLDNVTSIGSEGYLWHNEIKGNPLLTSLSGLDNVTYIRGYSFNINNNDSLTSLNGLESLNTIDAALYVKNNNSLLTLEGLNNLDNVASIHIGSGPSSTDTSSDAGNPNLHDFCALTNILINNPNITFIVDFNAYNPSNQDMTDGNCNQ